MASKESGALRLAELRKLAGRSQARVATSMGTTQSAVSRTERQGDLLLSTLDQYVAALGGSLKLCVDLNGQSVELDVLDSPTPVNSGRREFRVIWQDSKTRRLVHVGWLEAEPHHFVYTYTAAAQTSPTFQPFPSFPDLSATYQAKELFPFFAARLTSAADPNYDATLEALGLTRENATPIELLSRAPSGSPHDSIQVVPEPVELPDGSIERLVLASGARHADAGAPDAIAAIISRLDPGSPLTLAPEPSNPHNPAAIQIVYGSQPLGWIPDYLLDEIHGYLDRRARIDVSVVRASGPETPWHLRLLCRLTVSAHQPQN